MNLRTIVWLLTALLVTAGLGCLLPSAAQAQKRGGTLIYMVPSSDAPSLDAHQEETFAVVHATAPFYSLLLHVDPRSKGGKETIGDLATGWKVSADGKTYTFALRTNALFHDGSPVMAGDVVASLNHIIAPPEGVISPRRGFFELVESVSAQDDHTVEIKLRFASSAFIPALAMPFNYIYKADLLAKDPQWYKKNVMGSGPFKFVSYTPGDKMVGVRNEKYYVPGLPYLDGFEAIYSPKETVQLQALRGGRAHANFRGFPPQARDDLVRAMGDGIVAQESDWNCYMLAIPNLSKKPFSDKRVRQALNLAFDRYQGSEFLSKIAIVRNTGGILFPGHELAPSQAQLETLPGFSRDIAASRKQARALLREAGVPEGFKAVFTTRNTDQPYKYVGTWMIDQWRQIGLDFRQEVLPTGGWYDKLRSNPPVFDVINDVTCQSVLNPTLDVAKYISADKSDNNWARYIDRKMDELFEAQMREPNLEKQRALLWQMQQRLSDEQWMIGAMWYNRIVLHSSKMKWWEVTPSHYLNMQLAEVWLDQ